MAEHSFGSVLEYSVDGGTWTEIAEIKDMQFSGIERSMVNANYLNMPTYKMRKRPGLEDGGEFSFNAHVTEGVLATLQDIKDVTTCDDSPWYFRVTHPCTEEVDTFRGWLSKLGETFPEDDMILIPGTITLTDEWELGT